MPPMLGTRPMTPAERQRRSRSLRALQRLRELAAAEAEAAPLHGAGPNDRELEADEPPAARERRAPRPGQLRK